MGAGATWNVYELVGLNLRAPSRGEGKCWQVMKEEGAGCQIRELEAGSHLRRDAAALSEWWQAWQAAEAVPSLEAGRAPRL